MIADYVVVGAGAAGCALAGRLAADGRRDVLLLEQGGVADDPRLIAPRGYRSTLRDDRFVSRYPTSTVGPDGHAESWIRGSVLGGSTAVNGMMWIRGGPADWDALAARGNPGWGWDAILPAFREVEDHVSGASPLHGAGGPLPVTIAPDDPLMSRAVDAGVALGWKRVEDIEADDGDRIARTPQTIRAGQRWSAYRAFVEPLLDQPNLRVVTGVRVGSLLMDGRRATGVLVRRGGRGEEIRARREVVLSAGAIETPLILERSGIGNPAALGTAGVPVLVESPNVGERMIEHRGVTVQVRLRDDPGLATRGANAAAPEMSSGYDVVCRFRSSHAVARPDVQGIVAPFTFDSDGPERAAQPRLGALFLGYPIRPTTTSSVHITHGDPTAPVSIEPHYLASTDERRATVAALRAGRALFAAEPLADLVVDEEAPGPSIVSDADVVRYAWEHGGGLYHAVGSAAMGPDDEDVVDPTLRVRGVDGLRIADASVLPFHTSPSTAAPSTIVGWRAGAMILDED